MVGGFKIKNKEFFVPIEKKVVVGALNITLHPHDNDEYVKLFKKLFRLRKEIHIRGDQYAIITALSEKVEGKHRVLAGDIFKYTRLEKNDWFNQKTGTFATDEEIEKIEIPDNLQPNSARFSFVFYPKKHALFYEGYYKNKTFSPTMSTNFFKLALNLEELKSEFGQVNVTHVPEKEKVEEILSLKNKEQITYTVTRPNPDTLDQAQTKFLRNLDSQNITELNQEIKAVEGKEIELNEDSKTFARIAAKNGKVKIKARDATNKIITVSTENHPFQKIIYFDINKTETYYVFQNTVLSLINTISSWFK
jgi:hypothetical protein